MNALPLSSLVRPRWARCCSLLFGCVVGCFLWGARAAGFELRTNDVVAFLGGEDSVEMHRLGYVELLAVKSWPARQLRFRGLGWEGDTVFDQPRELNFPKWPDQLKRAGATVVFCQFGQAEALAGSQRQPDFLSAYTRLLDQLAGLNLRVVVLTPTRFEAGRGLLPDLRVHNAVLETLVPRLRELAAQRGHGFVDLFQEPAAPSERGFTRDGWHLNVAGQWWAAQRIASELGWSAKLSSSVAPGPEGRLLAPEVQALHAVIQTKCRLWFDYWRPQNWAFLAGDRTEQPSSRDHRDPKVRWFPAEMEQFVPLIEAREREITELAQHPLRLQ